MKCPKARVINPEHAENLRKFTEAVREGMKEVCFVGPIKQRRTFRVSKH